MATPAAIEGIASRPITLSSARLLRPLLSMAR
jgi:hypothetical protein